MHKRGAVSIGMMKRKEWRGGESMAFSDLEILARILECEAGGEGDTGMKAVACVVMNLSLIHISEPTRPY